jgi:hypothetical protein
MPHGFVGRVGTLKAADQAMDAVGAFLAERLVGSRFQLASQQSTRIALASAASAAHRS